MPKTSTPKAKTTEQKTKPASRTAGVGAPVARMESVIESTAKKQSFTGEQAGAENSATEALRTDHRRVEQLFSDYEASVDPSRKGELIQLICAELIVHTQLEEELFYPACRAALPEEELLNEAQVEHDTAKVLIADLLDGDSSDPFRDAKVSVLSEQIKHHVAEEERPANGLFARAKAHDVDKPELARRLKERKATLQRRAAELRPTRAVSLSNIMEDDMARYSSSERDRDERGRFMSDDDDDRRGQRSGYRSGGGRRFGDDDDDSRGRGWFGASEGHREAARRRFDDNDDRRGASRGSSRRDDDDRGGRGGWFGDSEGHREAARRRFDDDDDRRGASRGSSRRDDDDRGGRGRGGWFDDSEGHREAARRRFDDDDDRRGGSRGSTRRDDDDDHGGRGHGGWFGDSRGHAQAARRGWEDRR